MLIRKENLHLNAHIDRSKDRRYNLIRMPKDYLMRLRINYPAIAPDRPLHFRDIRPLNGTEMIEIGDITTFIYAIDYAYNVMQGVERHFFIEGGSWMYLLHDVLHGIHDVDHMRKEKPVTVSSMTEAERFFQAYDWSKSLALPVENSELEQIDRDYLCHHPNHQMNILEKTYQFKYNTDTWKQKCL